MVKKKTLLLKKYTSLDNILKDRFHGCVNIRGIRYQILYSIYKTFEEYQNDTDFKIQLEGLEDLDLKGINLNNIFIQVKTSDNKYNWAKYKDVFKNFYEVYLLNNEAHFCFVINTKHNNDWLKLTSNSDLDVKEQKRLENKIIKISNTIGVSDLNFYKRIKLISLDEDDLYSYIKKSIFRIYNNVSDKLSDIFIDYLFSIFLEKAQTRMYVDKILLDNIWIELNTCLSKQNEFSSIGEGLISKIEWKIDESEDDFFDGKRVRPSHIESKLDVPRTKWLEKIDKGINGANVCIIRASSGQGKSTLLFRYAHDYWDEEYVYVLKSAQNIKEVELIKEFLNYLKKMKFTILLLIDNINYHTALWPEVAGFCASIKIRVLVSIRHEDWFRFSNPIISNYEIVDPVLDLSEAKQIYETFSIQNRIHYNVTSYQWAFEKIGEPRLLMEFVYLITHGEMLRERLEKQVKYIAENEDKVKIEILRIISSADLLGSPVKINKLLEETYSKSDLQLIIKSLEGEYIEISNGILKGLHWIRSQHLTNLLHEQIYKITDTAVKILKLIPNTNLAYYITSCIVHKEIDNDKILNCLKSLLENNSLNEIEEIFKGLFIGGEQCFFLKNKAIFKEAFDLLGFSGVHLLGMSTTPTNMINVIDSLYSIGKNETIEKLKTISLKIISDFRGKDLCNTFAGLIERKLLLNKFTKNAVLKAPNIFFWIKLAGIEIDTSFFSDQFSDINEFERYNENSIYNILSGLYEYSIDEYFKWYTQYCCDFHNYLRYKTDTIELEIKDNELSFDFIQLNDDLSPHEQAMSRLEKYREAIPFCSKYSSHAINLLPFGLEPSIKDTEKNIPVENLHLPFYKHLNRYWLDIIERYFLPDSFYSFEESHYNLRNCIISYFSILIKYLKNCFIQKKYNIEKALIEDNLFENIKILLDIVPDPPNQCEERIREKFKNLIRNSQTHFRNFFYQFIEYFNQKRKKETGRLALHNLRDYMKYLSDLYDGFNLVTSISIDYFGIISLKEQEMQLAENLIYLFKYYIDNWQRIPIYDYEVQIEEEKKLFNFKIIQNVKEILSNKNVILSDSVLLEYPISYLPLYLKVDNPLIPEECIKELLPLFKEVKNKPSFYYIIPIYEDHLIIDGGYRISSTLDEKNFFWESFVPQKVPKNVMSMLPFRKKKNIKKLSFKNDLLKCIGLIDIWIKLEKLINTKEDDYFISKLNSKLIDKYLNIYKELKGFFKEIDYKYRESREEFQQAFFGLKINDIFKFVTEIIRIEKPEIAMAFIHENIDILDCIFAYFQKINDGTLYE